MTELGQQEGTVQWKYRKFVEYGQSQEDVTFLVGPEGKEEEVKSSVFILSALSPVFRSMFGENWKGQKEVIPLPDCQPRVFRTFLKVLIANYQLLLIIT